jgi:hypothetical protein
MKGERILAVWPKKFGNVIRVVFGTYNGKVRLDIREWYSKNGDLLPTRKGISLEAPLLGKLSKTVKKARALARKKGLVQ